MSSMPRTPAVPTEDESSSPEREDRGAVPQILVIDDDADFGRLLVLRLKAVGLSAHHMESAIGLSARLLEPPGFDLVMLDCMMPALTGPAVLGLFGRHPRLMKIPVVLMSASSDFRDAVANHPQAVFVEKEGHLGPLIDKVVSMLPARASTEGAPP